MKAHIGGDSGKAKGMVARLARGERARFSETSDPTPRAWARGATYERLDLDARVESRPLPPKGRRSRRMMARLVEALRRRIGGPPKSGAALFELPAREIPRARRSGEGATVGRVLVRALFFFLRERHGGGGLVEVHRHHVVAQLPRGRPGGQGGPPSRGDLRGKRQEPVERAAQREDRADAGPGAPRDLESSRARSRAAGDGGLSAARGFSSASQHPSQCPQEGEQEKPALHLIQDKPLAQLCNSFRVPTRARISARPGTSARARVRTPPCSEKPQCFGRASGPKAGSGRARTART